MSYLNPHTHRLDTPTGHTAGLHQAVTLLRRDRSPLAAGIADLLEAIAVDMDTAGARRTALFAGTAAEHLQVFDDLGMRMDWTAALELAALIRQCAAGPHSRDTRPAPCLGQVPR